MAAAALSYQYSGGYNTFIPNLDTTAQGGLIVEFSRAPDKFHLNKYTQLQQVEVESGKYWRFDANAMARINTGDGSQFIWADAADRPAQNIWQGFQMPAYNCTRLNFGFQLGDLAKYHAQKAGGVDLTAVNSRTAAGAAMVQRARKALARMTDFNVMNSWNVRYATGGTNPPIGYAPYTGNQFPAQLSTAGLADGGSQGDPTTPAYWDQGTPAIASANPPWFRWGVNAIMAQIVQLSNGMVQPRDINMIMGPDTALTLANSSEILDFVKQSVYALKSLEQDETFNMYGLPSQLFGVSLIVEDASYISAHPLGSNTPTRSFVIPYGTIIFASRPGGIEGAIMSFSTVMGFYLEEMTVEVFDLPQHRYVQGNVVDNYDYQITAPITGFVAVQAVKGS